MATQAREYVEMTTKPKPKGRPGRPRTKVPASADVRTSTTINATKVDRRRIDKIKSLYGLTTGGAAVRWCVRSQLQVMQAKGQTEVEVEDVRGQRTLSAFTLWMNEKERKMVTRLRKGYRLDSDADAIRFAIKEEAERVGL